MKVSVKILSMLIATCILMACDKRSDVGLVSSNNAIVVKLPLMSGCDDTIKKVEESFSKATKDKSYRLEVAVESFDVIPISHSEIKGIVSLISVGAWKTLDGGSPRDYLLTEANSIRASCMPNNGATVKYSELELMQQIIEKKSAKYVRATDGGVVIYFNDGKYKYPTP